MYRSIAIVVAVIVVSLLAVACGSETPTPAPTATPMTTPTETPMPAPTATPTSIDDNTKTGTYKAMEANVSLSSSKLVTKYAGKIHVVLDDGTSVSVTCPKATALALKRGEKVTVTRKASGGWAFAGTAP